MDYRVIEIIGRLARQRLLQLVVAYFDCWVATGEPSPTFNLWLRSIPLRMVAEICEALWRDCSTNVGMEWQCMLATLVVVTDLQLYNDFAAWRSKARDVELERLAQGPAAQFPAGSAPADAITPPAPSGVTGTPELPSPATVGKASAPLTLPAPVPVEDTERLFERLYRGVLDAALVRLKTSPVPAPAAAEDGSSDSTSASAEPAEEPAQSEPAVEVETEGLSDIERKAERRRARDGYRDECKRAGVTVTDEMIAKAASPPTATKRGWRTRYPIQKWLQLDPRYDGEPDRLIRKVFRDKPHLPKRLRK
jgi:hypothetical protein